MKIPRKLLKEAVISYTRTEVANNKFLYTVYSSKYLFPIGGKKSETFHLWVELLQFWFKVRRKGELYIKKVKKHTC